MYTELFLFTLLCFVHAHHGHQTGVCGIEKVQCSCGIGENQRNLDLYIEKHFIQSPVTGKTKCMEISDPYQACANHTCRLAAISQLFPTGNESMGSGAQSHDFEVPLFPKKFTVPRGERHRFTRESDPCHVPSLNNAEVTCWKWTNWINCDIRCLYGYALEGPEGIVTTLNVNCRRSEDVWKPRGFTDCEPYVNCRVFLVKPGDLKCKEPKNAPPYCDISCFDYDQYEATELQRYECNDDAFGSMLPHCAMLQDSVYLIEKPEKNSTKVKL